MPRNRKSGRCSRICMLIYTILFWMTGFALLFIGLWMILDPRRTYILDLVDFSEDDPLLRFAAYTAIVTGIGTLFVGFLSCCGAIKAERCMLYSFIIFLFIIFVAEIAIGLLAVFYKEKFTGDRMEVYVANMSHNRYYRDKWVTPLLDTIQYYVASPAYRDHLKSLIQHDYGVNTEQRRNGRVTRLVDSLQFYQQCCGGKGPWDYYNSFWYITNTERGTRSYVPVSCCRQTQNARAWSLQPIDTMCTTYFYGIKAFNASVNTQGCHEKLQRWFDEQSFIFAIVGFAFAAFQMLGIFIASVLLKQLNDYTYLE